MPNAVEVLTRLGGVASWAQLRRQVHWRAISTALEAGTVARTGPGRYALPSAEQGRVAASRLTGVASHTTAAAYWGWAIKAAPVQPHVTVHPKRKLGRHQRDGVTLHWRDLALGDVADGWVTTPARTVIDCCLDLPFDEALAVFDSSWRGGLKPREVQIAAMSLVPRQCNRVLALARASDPRAANPFESVLRAIARDVPGLVVVPQRVIKDRPFYARVDLADDNLRIVLEADSFEFHTGRTAFDRDCRRYNGLVVRRWLVLRFSWEQVMFDPKGVREMLMAAVAGQRRELRRRRILGQPTGTRGRNSARTA
jgi:very-short-patch-repair endonuclease